MSVTRDRVHRKWPGVTVRDVPGTTARYYVFDHRLEGDPTVTATQASLRNAQKGIANYGNLGGDTRQHWMKGTTSGIGLSEAQMSSNYP